MRHPLQTAVLVAIALHLACGQPRQESSAPAPSQPAPQPTNPPGPGSGLPPGLPPGRVVILGFMGLSFYPGSEDKMPGVTPGPKTPSARLTSDSVAQVAAFYRRQLGNTVKDSKVGSTTILDGTTPAGPVRVTAEPFEGRTQVTIAAR